MNKENNIEYITVDQLHPHPDNPRKELGDLTELTDSIKANGIYQNLTVIRRNKPLNGYTVVIGHRRLAAAKLAGLTELPCVVAEMDPKEQMQTMLLENMQRSDLTIYEQAQGFQMMLDLGATVDEIAEKSGFSQNTVRRRVKMMELDQEKLKKVSARQITLGDFDTLAQIEDIEERNKALDAIGTNNFLYEVNRAKARQIAKKNLPIVKAWLEKVGAKEITREESWTQNYRGFPGLPVYIYLSNWGKDRFLPPEQTEEQVFYRLDDEGVYLYKKNANSEMEKESPEALAKKEAVEEAWNKLTTTAFTAHELRKKFVEGLELTEKNRAAVLSGAFSIGVYEVFRYNYKDEDTIRNILRSDDLDGKEISKRMKNLEARETVQLVYALFGDDADMDCAEEHDDRKFPKYEQDCKLLLIYDWLASIGYEMSTEEQQLLNGEHESFHAADNFAAAE